MQKNRRWSFLFLGVRLHSCISLTHSRDPHACQPMSPMLPSLASAELLPTPIQFLDKLQRALEMCSLLHLGWFLIIFVLAWGSLISRIFFTITDYNRCLRLDVEQVARDLCGTKTELPLHIYHHQRVGVTECTSDLPVGCSRAWHSHLRHPLFFGLNPVISSLRLRFPVIQWGRLNGSNFIAAPPVLILLEQRQDLQDLW